MLKPKTLRITLLLTVCLALLTLAARTGTAATSPGLREHLLHEPVFHQRTFIREAGVGNPRQLLLVHGLGDRGSDDWLPLITELSSSYHIVAVDLPGFGRSDKPDAIYSPTNYARYLKWVSEQFLTGRFTLAGHSLGGAITLKFAELYPGDIDHLILVDVAGILHRKALMFSKVAPELESKMRWPLPGTSQSLGELLSDVVLRSADSNLDITTILNNRLMRRTLLAGSPTKIAALALIEEDFSKTLRSITVPCDILWGADDKVTSLRIGRMLAAVLPSAKLHIIDGAGHVPMQDHPAQFNAIFSQALMDPAKPAKDVQIPQDAPAGICVKQRGMRFQGVYSRIDIAGCLDVEIDNVATTQINIRDSVVAINNTRVDAADVALTTTASRLEVTGSRFSGTKALVTDGSSLDFVGVDLSGTAQTIEGHGVDSNALFSVCSRANPHRKTYLHGAYLLEGD